MKIGIASDHAGYELKEKLKKYLQSQNYEVIDYGTYSLESVDYPDFAHKLALGFFNKEFDYGISLCGTGNGISMVLNRYPFIRAALCWNKEISYFARLHNDANICSLPARFIDYDTAVEIIDIFLKTNFEGGRHLHRIQKINPNI